MNRIKIAAPAAHPGDSDPNADEALRRVMAQRPARPRAADSDPSLDEALRRVRSGR